MITHPPPGQTRPDGVDRLARALESLAGLSVGDAFGERFFGPPADSLERIRTRTLPPPEWLYTDDTVMALSIVQVLKAQGRLNQDALADAFAVRYQQAPARGYGAGAHAILRAIGLGTPWKQAAAMPFDGQGSYGNGGAMRAGPLGAYWKVTVERPLRLHSQLSIKAIQTLRFASGDEDLRAPLYEEFGEDLFTSFSKVSGALEKRLADWGPDEEDGDEEEGGGAKKGLPEKKRKKLLDAKSWERDGRLIGAATTLRATLGDQLHEDYNVFCDRVDAALKQAGLKLPAADLKQILKAVSWRVETAPPVIAKVYKAGKIKPDPLHGLFEATVDGKATVVEYEPDSDLRDTEQVPLLEEGGIAAFIRREVLPYTPDAWVKEEATKIGYEVSFTRHFYKPQPLRTLEEISADILAVEREAEGLLDGLLKQGQP